MQRHIPYTTVALFLIVGLAAWLRLAAPGLTEFKADEARLLKLAYAMVEGQFPVRGIASSIGIANPPASVWLYALPVLFWRHPYAATLFAGAVNVLAVFWTWRLARRWGTMAALTAALLMTVAPWGLFFSRRIWSQNLLQPLVLLWGLSAAAWYVDGRRRALAAHVFVLIVAVQVHFAAIGLLPATLYLIWQGRRRVGWPWAAAGAAGGLVTALPYLLYLRRTPAELNTLNALAGGEATRPLLAAVRNAWQLTLGVDINAVAGPALFPLVRSLTPLLPWARAGLGVLIVAGVLILLATAWPRRTALALAPDPAANAERRSADLLLAWLLAPIVTFTLPWTDVVLHYLLPIFPVPFIAVGIAVAQLFGRRARRPTAPGSAALTSTAVAALLVTGIAAAQLHGTLTLHRIVTENDTQGAYGTPLRRLLTAASVARQAAESADQSIVIAGAGENPAVDPFAAVFDTLLHRTPHRFVDAPHAALFPAGGAVILVENGVNGATDLYRAAATSRADVPLRAGEGRLSILTVPATPPLPGTAFAPAYLFANWIAVTGYSWTADGAASTLDIHWRTGDNPDPQGYHFFNHLLDAEGDLVAQADRPVFAPQQWQAGDRVISRFTLAAPPDAGDVLRTGVYRVPSQARVPLLDVAGNPYADAIEIAPER